MDLNIKYRYATPDDIILVCDFTDFWIASRGQRVNAPGATNDYFISPSQHKKYISKYETWLAFIDEQLIGWAVINTTNTLIYFLIHGEFRRAGIGSDFLKYIQPQFIRSKNNQQSGNPAPFYEKLGFQKIRSETPRRRFDIDKLKPHRAKTIDVFEQKNR